MVENAGANNSITWTKMAEETMWGMEPTRGDLFTNMVSYTIGGTIVGIQC